MIVTFVTYVLNDGMALTSRPGQHDEILTDMGIISSYIFWQILPYKGQIRVAVDVLRVCPIVIDVYLQDEFTFQECLAVFPGQRFLCFFFFFLSFCLLLSTFSSLLKSFLHLFLIPSATHPFLVRSNSLLHIDVSSSATFADLQVAGNIQNAMKTIILLKRYIKGNFIRQP
ncbi:hypothetical protein L9F63_024118, partial [Diploptera punctata]